jgi:hypothetical protein
MLTVFQQLVRGVSRTLTPAKPINARNGGVDFEGINDTATNLLFAVSGLRDSLRQVVHHLRFVARHFVIRGAQ